MDRGAWRVTIHRVTKSQTRLSDFHFPSRILVSLTESLTTSLSETEPVTLPHNSMRLTENGQQFV